MPWTYTQSTGQMTNGARTYNGYSGSGNAINDPNQEASPRLGPIPRGQWRMEQPFNSQNTGPFAIPLTPVGHNAHGRSAFQIHGESNDGVPRNASSGCIIISPRASREAIWNSGDRVLNVVR